MPRVSSAMALGWSPLGLYSLVNRKSIWSLYETRFNTEARSTEKLMRDAPLVAILARGNLFSVTWDGDAAQWLFPKHFVARRIIGPVFQDTKVQFTRIMIDPRRMGGVPCIRELRIPVATVLDMV